MADDGTIDLPPELRAALQLPDRGTRQGGVPLPEPLSFSPDHQFDDAEIVIDVGDGAVSLGIDEDGTISAPFIRESRDNDEEFSRNLALDCNEGILSSIAEEIVSGVEMDILSRTPWYEQYQKGLDLLPTKIEDVGSSAGRKNISRAGDTTLMEAMVKYQAAAEAEMLPAAGPAKVQTVGDDTTDEEIRAKRFEDDFNYFLTEKAPEYYPDTGRMLMHQAFGGNAYKKVYYDPIRRRPVSESVLATDMIISEEATDLDSAIRVTHRIEMAHPTLRRMMLAGQYRDIDLGQPGVMGFGIADGIRRSMREAGSGGVMFGFARPQDQPYEIWETDAFIDPDGIPGEYEYDAPEGLTLPYKVTIDRTSRKILGIWRNWRQPDELYLKRNMYVKFGLIPSLGYHDWGFLQLLGNQTRSLRAILRLLIDAGMYSNFPAGLKAKNARAATNELAPSPGEWVDLDIPANADINKLVMNLPYKEPSTVLVQLMEIVKQDAKGLAGTTEIEVGEGRANMPVGTIMSLIEQQVQVLAGVHKRNHRSQRREFGKIRELFAENPKSLSILCRDRPRAAGDNSARMWEKAEEFINLNLLPVSDPNIPTSIHRKMMANVLLMLAQQVPQYFDVPAVLETAVREIGYDPNQYIVRPDPNAPVPPPPPDPKVQAATIRQQTEEQKGMISLAKMQAEDKIAHEKLAVEAAKAAAGNETALHIAKTKAATEVAAPYHEAHANPTPPVLPST